MSGARNTAETKASRARAARKRFPSGWMKTMATESRVIAKPAMGTQPSSMRLRSSNEARPKPAAMPSDAAAMKVEESVPNPSPPPVMTLASFTDHKLMNAANPQKKATPSEAWRSGASCHSPMRLEKWLTASFALKFPLPCAGTRGMIHARMSAGAARAVRINSGTSAADHAASGEPPRAWKR